MRPRSRSRRSLCRLAAIGILPALGFTGAPLAGQTLPPAPVRVPLAADSAATLPAGAFRVGISGVHTTARDRYIDGRLGGLGGPLTGPLGPAQFSLLGSIEDEVTALGVQTFTGSLGTARLDARQRLFVTPLSVEYGLTDRWTIGVSSSLVRTKAEALFRIDGAGATLGRNPVALGTGVGAANAATIGAYANAASNLTTRRDDCIANAGSSPECPTILAEAAEVNALIGLTSDFATRLTALYGTSAATGSAWVPLEGSAAELALLARVDSIRDAFVRYGVTDVTPTTGLPLGAQTPLTSQDLEYLVRDVANGFGAKPLEKGGLTALGDVHVATTVRLADRLRCAADSTCATPERGIRSSLRVGYLLATGARKRADRLLDQGTGAGFDAVGIHSLTDLALTRRASASVAVGVTQYFGDEVRMRVPTVAAPTFLEAWREALVTVTPGKLLEVGVTPQWRAGDHLALGLRWQLAKQLESRHDVNFDVTDPRGATVNLSGAALDALSGWSEQRFGFTATYSMLPALARGLRRMPIDITLAHTQTLFGHSGVVVKRWEDRVMVRYYARLRGR